jgi:hypothetical protein
MNAGIKEDFNTGLTANSTTDSIKSSQSNTILNIQTPIIQMAL